jgi:hypothetical protein
MEGPAAQTGGGTGWEKPLAGEGFEVLRRANSHRGDRGAVCQQTWLWGPEIAGREVGQEQAGARQDELGYRSSRQVTTLPQEI